MILQDLFFVLISSISKRRRAAYFVFMVIGLIAISIYFLNVYFKWSEGLLVSDEMFRRLTRKRTKFGGSWLYSFIRDRNLVGVINHPEVFLYGSGGGHMERFSITGDRRELHSTWIALAFYYGIIPFLFLISWIQRNLKGIKKIYLVPILALVIESFTLVNFRQPTFWILFVLVGYCSADDKPLIPDNKLT